MATKTPIRLPLMIDSGAFSAFHQKKPLDVFEYIEYLLKVVEEYPEAEYVNLDVIGGDGSDSYRNWSIMRAAGLNPLPVYHVSTDPKWLKRYMRHTDSIGLGAIANMSTQKRTWALDRIWHEYLVDPDRMPKVKVHAMGVTSFPLMQRYPWYSIDSTSWLQAAMYGKLFIPHTTNGQWDYNRKPYVIGVSSRSPMTKERGQHISNLPPRMKQHLMRYIEMVGFKYGKSKFVDGKEEILVPGLSNRYEKRCELNVLFYAKFVKLLLWPRRFEITPPEGLLQ